MNLRQHLRVSMIAIAMACGNHSALSVKDISLSRETDDRLTVHVRVRCSAMNDCEDSYCVRITWFEPPADGRDNKDGGVSMSDLDGCSVIGARILDEQDVCVRAQLDVDEEDVLHVTSSAPVAQGTWVRAKPTRGADYLHQACRQVP